MAIDQQQSPAALSKPTARALLRLVRLTFPHAEFPDGPYERVVDKIAADAAEDAALAGLLEQGVRDLDAAGGAPFVELSEDDARALVERSVETPIFTSVRATAVVALYDQAEVWELLGYEGPSFHLGGYLERGFDDLDWLPDPPV